MAKIANLEKLAREITGRDVEVQKGQGAHTDGEAITVLDAQARWPRLSQRVTDDMERVLTAHEASHIALFDREARKLGLSSLSGEEMYKRFADPLAPDAESEAYVRHLANVVEDKLTDEHAARFVGKKRQAEVNRFFVWNRQGGGTRPSMAELEASGKAGQCAAFVEAIFQLELYGELIESFQSPALERAAREAAEAIEHFGQGALSRKQALRKVLEALARYCPPPWRFPEQYQPPRGKSGQGQGQGSPQQGSGQGQGQGQNGQQGQSGEGQGGEGDGDGDGEGSQGQGSEGSEGSGQGEPSTGSGQGGDGSGSGSGSEGSEESEEGDQDSDGDGNGSSEGSESQSASDGEEASSSGSRGSGTGESPGDPQKVQREARPEYDDPNIMALLDMLESVIGSRSNETGRGLPNWKTWAPGDLISAPDEIQRYAEDDAYGIDPLERRCVRRRYKKRHLLAVFIDSSGSVNDALFGKLYSVFAEIAEKVADKEGCFLGVGQFSGGADWVLEPTRDVVEIREFAEQEPARLYSGNTVVAEIYQLLPEYFAGYETADLIVLTDGYVEDGNRLAISLEAAHEETGCAIKLHGATFRGTGSTLSKFRKAKRRLPEFVRTWNLG